MKITFVTFHNWDTKRVGGFHKFAEYAADEGHDVVFFSFDRPYFIMFKREERLNVSVLRTLTKGKVYKTEKANRIINCTWPTLRIPQPFYRFVPTKINKWLNTHSLIPFGTFADKFLAGTDVFVIESCAALELYDVIHEKFPLAHIVYRPSDPIVAAQKSELAEEEKYVLYSSEKVYIVNNEGVELYRRNIPDFDTLVDFELLPNGVDTEKFKLSYECPKELKTKNTALYVGARQPEWELIRYSAKACPEIKFIIVCPEKAPKDIIKGEIANILYVPGISPSDVPAWITNCDVVIIPNPNNLWKMKPWGITAKYYQAMAAGKPIVSFSDTPRLKEEFGVEVTYEYEQFVECLKKNMDSKGKREYKGLNDREWQSLCGKFISSLCKIVVGET